MKIAIRYYSKTGNTKKLANTISQVAEVEALTVNEPLLEDIDVLFLASSVYGSGVSSEVKRFINNIDVNIGEIVNVSSAAIIDSTFAQVKKIAEKNGLKMSEQEYHCRGKFTLMHKGRPNSDDLLELTSFTRSYLNK